MTQFWQRLGDRLWQKTGHPADNPQASSVGGGCINQAFRLRLGGGQFFVKLNVAGNAEMFAAEHEGLEEISRSATVRVPEPILHGVLGDKAYLVTEWLDLDGTRNEEVLGQELAAMHVIRADSFGWHRDNTIGRTPQINLRSSDWVHFYSRQRLEYQIELLAKNGHPELTEPGQQLIEQLGSWFTTYQPWPALVHGDLWAGNSAALGDGTPVIYDPAVYYGDRETDLAMMEMFGGFAQRCFDAYAEALTIDDGYRQRKPLYQLYHVLNHANLFGGGYVRQSAVLLQRLNSAR